MGLQIASIYPIGKFPNHLEEKVEEERCLLFSRSPRLLDLLLLPSLCQQNQKNLFFEENIFNQSCHDTYFSVDLFPKKKSFESAFCINLTFGSYSRGSLNVSYFLICSLTFECSQTFNKLLALSNLGGQTWLRQVKRIGVCSSLSCPFLHSP